VYVEEPGAESSPEGTEKAGLFTLASPRIAQEFATAFEPIHATVTMIEEGCSKLGQAIDELEIEFALKAVSEVSGFIFCKVSGEATFKVRLVWKPTGPAKST
jgi:hypothetical protein